MLEIAFIMAVLIFASFMILFYKLPPRVRNFLARRYLIMDFSLCFLTFMTLGFAITSIMAAGIISVLVSGYLLWYKSTHPLPPRKPKIKRVKVPKYTCKPHIYWAARVYNWLKCRREHDRKVRVITTG